MRRLQFVEGAIKQFPYDPVLCNIVVNLVDKEQGQDLDLIVPEARLFAKMFLDRVAKLRLENRLFLDANRLADAKFDVVGEANKLAAVTDFLDDIAQVINTPGFHLLGRRRP